MLTQFEQNHIERQTQALEAITQLLKGVEDQAQEVGCSATWLRGRRFCRALNGCEGKCPFISCCQMYGNAAAYNSLGKWLKQATKVQDTDERRITDFERWVGTLTPEQQEELLDDLRGNEKWRDTLVKED